MVNLRGTIKMRNRHLKTNGKRKMLTQMIIRLPTSTDFDDLPEGTLDHLTFIGQVSGSQSYYSRILVLALSKSTKGDLTSFFNTNDLNWTVLAEEGKPLIQTQIVKFMVDEMIDH